MDKKFFDDMRGADQWVEMKFPPDILEYLDAGNVFYYLDGYRYFPTLSGIYRARDGKYEFTSNFSVLPKDVRQLFVEIVRDLQNKLLSDTGIKAW